MAAPTTTATAGEETAGPLGGTFLGRPRWFTTLFGLDMWERFSFYGMAAILFLYASATKAEGGLGLSEDTATALFGVYLASVFLASVPGGWLGDRILGARRATLYGGVLIALGHCSMALPAVPSVYVGMALIAAGTGLLKPNLATVLAACYARDSRAERDAGFAIFYMSIQVSAVAAPIVCGALGESVDWHLGFGAAAVGMLLGLAQFLRGTKYFGEIGQRPERPASAEEWRRVKRRTAAAVTVLTVLYGADAAAGTFDLRHVLALGGLLSIVLPVVCFRRLLRNPVVTAQERERIRSYIWLFLSAAFFWMLYIQGSTVLSLFAKVGTDRTIGGFTVPASWFQAVVPLFILAAAPVSAWLWVRLGDRLGAPAKFGIGLGLMGLSLLLMALATVVGSDGHLVSPLWLIAAYALQACGEVALAPVGMSVTTEVAPRTFVSQMIGLFWLAAALGAGVGGHAVQLSKTSTPGAGYYLALGVPALLAGTALILTSRRLRARLGV
ncbi:peptide MFS transporter [Streptomyces fildesensis]|uniref:Peptide MFS transporter n=1 Tax=Streptomyces fildesensis TaxID=375757 RepID=A0ABW8C7Y8_9ACTN